MKLTVVVLGCAIICSVVAVDFPTLSHLKPSKSDNEQTNAVKDLVSRVIGARAIEFEVSVNSSIGAQEKDTFILNGGNKKVEIVGTTGVAVAMGLYYYLSRYCGCMVTWGGEQLNIPSPLPKLPPNGEVVTTNDKFRYYQNVCTVSYSFAWYTWADWEKHLDWMALHGFNLPLAFNGQEAIFQRVYSELGFKMKDLQDHFGGPAFLAWARMGNMHGWGGPIPQNWIDDQLALQHMILNRMTSLGMIPVLPGFAGHVPEATRFLYPTANISRLADWAGFNASYCCLYPTANISRLADWAGFNASYCCLYPTANISRLADWAGFNASYCCNYLLDFNDPLFKKIGVEFIKQMKNEFGVYHIYSVDTFNEMNPRSGASDYLASASRVIYETLKEADSQAIWLMQGWLFLNAFWTPPRIKAYLTGVPTGGMIILDLYSEVQPVFTRTESYYGQPFIWCMLHDFGGTMELYGAFININNGPFDGRRFPNSTMIGVGITPEGIYQNEVVYEFFLENSWRKEPRDISNWISDYVKRRYGKTNKYLDLAWQYLKRSVYNNSDGLGDHSKDVITTTKPRISPILKQDKGVYNNTDGLSDHSKNVIPSTRPRITPQMRQDLSVYNDTDGYEDFSHGVIPTSKPRISPPLKQDLGVYNNTDYHHDNNLNIIPTVRPRITPLIQQDVWYNPEDLFVTWDLMTLSMDDYNDSALFMYDLVDITRNSLQIISMTYYTDFVMAFSKNDTVNMKGNADNLIGLLNDMETVLASDSHFLLGKWLQAAQNLAHSFDENFLYQFNARNQITLWGPRGEIRDYACKQWSGLMKDYYIPRWQMFLNYSMDCMLHNVTYNTNEINQRMYEKVELPFTYRLDQYPTEPIGNTVQIVSDLHKKYRPQTHSEFFQTLEMKSRLRRKNDKRDWIERKYGLNMPTESNPDMDINVMIN